MNSRLIIAGIAVAAVAVGGAYVGIGQVESKTERTVREYLANAPLKVETVEYNALSRTLKLGTVSWELRVADMSASGALENVSLKGFNLDSLTAAPSIGKVPLVADHIVATGGNVTSESSTTIQDKTVTAKSTGTFGEIVLDGWHQNLGNLTQLYLQEPWSETFFAEAYRYSLNDMSYSDYNVHMEISDMGLGRPMVLNMHIGKIGMLGKAGSADSSAAGAELAGRTFSMFADDMNMDMTDVMAVTVRRMEIHDMLLPTAKTMARLMTMMPELANMPNPELLSQSLLVPELLELLKADYSENAPYKKFVFEGYVVTPDPSLRANPVRLERLENTLAFGPTFQLGLSLTGLSLDQDKMPSKYRDLIAAFAPDGVLVDGSFHISLQPAAAGPSKMDLTGGFNNLGTAVGTVDFALNVIKLTDIFDKGFNPSNAVLVSGSEAKYTDNGALALLVALSSQDNGQTPEETLDMMRGQIPEMTSQAGPLAPMMADAAKIMLDKPGTMTVTSNFKTPMPAAMVFMSFLLDPESLNLVISATPGTKNLLDFMPQSLR